MAASQLRRFDVQANLAFVLSLISVAPFLVAAGLTLRNYDGNLYQITYGSGSKFAPLLLASLLLSMVPSFVAMLLGWNSAEQRRNDRSRRSWIGFFLGGFILTMDIILLLAFWKLRLEIPLG